MYHFATFILLFFTRFVLACICLQTSCLHVFVPARFRVFCLLWLCFCLPFVYSHPLHTKHHLLPLNPFECPSAGTILIVPTFLLNLTMCMSHNTSISHLFEALFCLFLLPGSGIEYGLLLRSAAASVPRGGATCIGQFLLGRWQHRIW